MAGLAAAVIEVVGLAVRHHPALVFDEPRVGRNVGRGEHAVAVDRGAAHEDLAGHGLSIQ